MKYPLENLTDTEFEDLVALICEQILGMGTIVFSVGKDGGKDAKFSGKANNFPSKAEPWNGKIIIQAKHTQRYGASCSDSDFKSIIKNEVIPAISKLVKNNEINYYLLFTNRKLSGIQDKKIEDIFNEKTNIENQLIALERIQLWLKEIPNIAKTLNLNRLLLPLDFNENDLKKIILAFSKIGLKKSNLSEIPQSRNIEKKNDINKLSKDYFNNAIKRNLPYFNQIKKFLENPINDNYLNKYQNTIDDINEEIIIHRDDYDKFEEFINYLYKKILNNTSDLDNNRKLIRLFLHYMYYNCDIGKNE
jgi:hypothetical protein